MNARRVPRHQHGWALLETAVALSLVGLLTVAVVTTTGRTTANMEARQALQDAEHAENALLGYARVNARLPAPEAGAPSATRPGYLEGWLPAGVLGLEGANRLRYVVEASLVNAPVIHPVDPLALADGRIAARTVVNGLDLCGKLMRIERAGTALPGGMRLGFAVQQAVSRESGSPVGIDRAWLGDDIPGAPPAGIRLGTRTRGPGEMAAALGCIARMPQLSAGVRSTATAIDLLRLASQETALRQLNLDLAEDSVLNARWRLGSWGTAIEKFIFALGLEILGAHTTEVSVVTGTLNAVSMSLAVAGVGMLLDDTRKGLKRAEASVEMSRAALDRAKTYAAQLRTEIDIQAGRAGQLQTEGLNP